MKFGAKFKFGLLNVRRNSGEGVRFEFGQYTNFKFSERNDDKISSEKIALFYLVKIFPYLVYNFGKNTMLSAQFNLGTPDFEFPITTQNQHSKIYCLYLVSDLMEKLNKVNFDFMIKLNEIFN